MAKFQKSVDIFTLTEAERAKLQPGQWVTAGPDDFGNGNNRGRYFGQSARGTDVCAWIGNARRNYREYMATMASYARGVRANA